MSKIRVLTVFGTRPEAIKMAPLVKELEKQPDVFKSIVCVTAQHRQMLDQVLKLFNIVPDYDLNIMKPNQDLWTITAEVLMLMKTVFEIPLIILFLNGKFLLIKLTFSGYSVITNPPSFKILLYKSTFSTG